ncbi:MAG: cellulase family glycosylhydrolase, partial [Armatimonadota bacterium]
MTSATCLLLAGAACALGAIGDLQVLTERLEQRQPLELSVEVDREVGNPYDPAELDVRVQVIAPSGHTTIVPAFYIVPHTGEAAGSALREVERFHFFLNASDWPEGTRIAFDVDDLEVSSSATGERRVLDDVEGEFRWTPGARITEAHSGQGAMHFEVTTAPERARWPGTTLPLGTQDWSDFDTLSVWIKPIAGLEVNRLGIEFYNSANEKFQTTTQECRGEGWRQIVWRFAPIFEATTWRPDGLGEWRARVFPQENGRYRFVARVNEAEGSPLREWVEAGAGGGLARVDERDPRYLRLDSGESLFLIGSNILAREVEEYRHYFDRIAAVGGNFVRLWLSPPYLGFETEQLGRFDQARAAQLDRVFELAAERGIYIMPAIMDFRETQTTGGSGPAWSRSLFARENGGPCADAVAFYTDETARAILKRRLRYLVARYSAYPSVMCWEFFNEVNLVDAWRKDPEIVRRWHAEMAEHLAETDPNGHIITSSFAGLPDDALWDQPLMHLVQRHHYYIGPGEFAAQIHPACEALSRHQKPRLVGEFGRTRNLHADADSRGASLYKGMWTTLVSGQCGTGMPWWWRWLDTYDLWRHMGAVAEFIEGIDFGAEGFEVLPEIEAAVGAYDEDAVGDAAIETPSPWSLRSIPIADRPREVTVGPDG